MVAYHFGNFGVGQIFDNVKVSLRRTGKSLLLLLLMYEV